MNITEGIHFQRLKNEIEAPLKSEFQMLEQRYKAVCQELHDVTAKRNELALKLGEVRKLADAWLGLQEDDFDDSSERQATRDCARSILALIEGMAKVSRDVERQMLCSGGCGRMLSVPQDAASVLCAECSNKMYESPSDSDKQCTHFEPADMDFCMNCGVHVSSHA